MPIRLEFPNCVVVVVVPIVISSSFCENLPKASLYSAARLTSLGQEELEPTDTENFKKAAALKKVPPIV